MLIDTPYPVQTYGDTVATFLFQAVDEYRDAGYLPIGYGDEHEFDRVCAVAQIELDGGRFDFDTVSWLRAVACPLVVIVCDAHSFDRARADVKRVRPDSADVFVRYFPHCDVVL